MKSHHNGALHPRAHFFKELSVAQVRDCFTITEPVIYEDLEFCSKGTAKEQVDAAFTLEGEQHVNLNGTSKAFSHLMRTSGLRMNCGVYKRFQLKGKPGHKPAAGAGSQHSRVAGGRRFCGAGELRDVPALCSERKIIFKNISFNLILMLIFI